MVRQSIRTSENGFGVDIENVTGSNGGAFANFENMNTQSHIKSSGESIRTKEGNKISSEKEKLLPLIHNQWVDIQALLSTIGERTKISSVTYTSWKSEHDNKVKTANDDLIEQQKKEISGLRLELIEMKCSRTEFEEKVKRVLEHTFEQKHQELLGNMKREIISIEESTRKEIEVESKRVRREAETAFEKELQKLIEQSTKEKNLRKEVEARAARERNELVAQFREQKKTSEIQHETEIFALRLKLSEEVRKRVELEARIEEGLHTAKSQAELSDFFNKVLSDLRSNSKEPFDIGTIVESVESSLQIIKFRILVRSERQAVIPIFKDLDKRCNSYCLALKETIKMAEQWCTFNVEVKELCTTLFDQSKESQVLETSVTRLQIIAEQTVRAISNACNMYGSSHRDLFKILEKSKEMVEGGHEATFDSETIDNIYSSVNDLATLLGSVDALANWWSKVEIDSKKIQMNASELQTPNISIRRVKCIEWEWEEISGKHLQYQTKISKLRDVYEVPP